jgi:predicted phage baseplate assembly protein
MTIPSPDLDDRTFQDIVDEAKRLIPKYCPTWTNHNLADPGIALIELFAWMTEMTLYRLNQVPDRLYAKFLELIGIDLFPASPARTELTFWLSAPSATTLVIPTGTQVGTPPGRDGGNVVFTTDEDLRIVQPKLTGFLTSDGPSHYRSGWEELRFGKGGVRVFTSDPLTSGDAFYLGFDGPLSGNTLRLDLSASVEGLGVNPHRPPLRWEIWTGNGWDGARVLVDETGGLNQDGIVTLLLPTDHAPITLGDKRAWWVRGRLDQHESEEAPYVTSPRIRAVQASSLGGTVSAHHGEPILPEILGHSDGLPGQMFQLRHRPVLPRRAGEVVAVTTEGKRVDWEEVEDFAGSAPHDHHVVWDPNDGEIRFGPAIRALDGSVQQHGAVPPKGAEIAVTGYRIGGGLAGNVGAGSLTVLRTTIPYVDRVSNLRPAGGGVDPEPIENAKMRAPSLIRTGQRAVTAHDYERLTLEADRRVARARCLAPAEPGGPVRVLIVPHTHKRPADLVLDDFALPDDLVDQVASYLDRRRTLGTTVEISTPYYQGLTVATRLKLLPGRPHEAVRQRALDLLYKYLNPLEGGSRGHGWPFDEEAGAAMVYELLEGVDGVSYVDDVLLFEADLRNQQRVGKGKEWARLDPDSLFLSFAHRVVVE